MDATSLPSEVWLYIHRIATADTSPMVTAYSDRFQYVPVSDPLKDPGQFWRIASSFVLVSRLWNSLANELLYENIRVDGSFDAHLRPALERSGKANLVRSVRLSPNRLDHNLAILAMCPRIQVIVQPEATRDLNSDTTPISLPSSHSLRQIYCEESTMNSGFLRRLVALAPDLEYLFLSHPHISQTDEEALPFPTIPNLRRLGVVPVAPNLTNAVLKAGMQNVTRLTCSPPLFRLPRSPRLSIPAHARPVRLAQRHPICADLLSVSAPARALLRRLEHLPRAGRKTCTPRLYPSAIRSLYRARLDVHQGTLPDFTFA
ncbi:hypothetical protein MSAN_02106200 [Mycena sanguinolenta]|uniref:Uncharacterized protein n=1 Tax=Mycena sanguinolenta TaxID=230812 RepID=A0A8H6XHT1_9AGAR|nr:hypothetical protein MSAN_02106200 [Mycena sanguinolenta]